MAQIDKFKTCKGCPDRSIHPNCHTSCEGYLHRVERQEAINKKRRQEADYDNYIHDQVVNIKKRFRHDMKNKKKFR